MVEVGAMPHDLLELVKRVAAFGPPILVRGQISSDDGWTSIPVRPGRSPDCAERGAASQVDSRIDCLRLVKVWVVACNVGVKAKWGRATGVAPIAVTHSVDQVAA